MARSKVTYYGLYLSKRRIKRGEKLNLMVLSMNNTQKVFRGSVTVYFQRADRAGSPWFVAAEQEYDFHVGEGTHSYFSIDLLPFLDDADDEAEFVAYCGEQPPECHRPGKGLSDIFIVD